MNNETNLANIKNVLKAWKKKGKSLPWDNNSDELKTLAKIIHLLINLPDAPDSFAHDFEAVLSEFLWNGKHSRIQTCVACTPHEVGGLKMLDVSW